MSQDRPYEGATDLFRESWAFYRKLVTHDLMSHRGIAAALRRYVQEQRAAPFDLWDLGCGDATGVIALFEGTPLRSYTGVDAAPPALVLAREQLAGAPFAVTLVEADFPMFLMQADPGTTDLIWIGFSLHHFHPDAKRAILADALRALRPGGALLVSDISRRSGESREAYLAAFLAQARARWSVVTPAEHERIEAHIVACDFPETPEGLLALARQAGFAADPVPLFRDPTGLHRLTAFPT